MLHEHSEVVAEYVFGDSATGLTETPDGVDVVFASGVRRTFDLVVGADGVHSDVRGLVFGPEERFVGHLGHHVVRWDVPDDHDVPAESSWRASRPRRAGATGRPTGATRTSCAATPGGRAGRADYGRAATTRT